MRWTRQRPVGSNRKPAQHWQHIAHYAKEHDLDFGLLVALCRDALAHRHTAITRTYIEAMAVKYQSDEVEAEQL